jgi:hypothetical protein
VQRDLLPPHPALRATFSRWEKGKSGCATIGLMVDVKVIRWQSAIAHTGVILWQVYSAATAWRSSAILQKLLKGLGAESGAAVTIFIVTSRWWWIVPVIFAVLSVAAIRRIETRPRFAISVLAAEVIAALVMNIWWRESFFGPLFALIGQVG